MQKGTKASTSKLTKCILTSLQGKQEKMTPDAKIKRILIQRSLSNLNWILGNDNN